MLLLYYSTVCGDVEVILYSLQSTGAMMIIVVSTEVGAPSFPHLAWLMMCPSSNNQSGYLRLFKVIIFQEKVHLSTVASSPMIGDNLDHPPELRYR